MFFALSVFLLNKNLKASNCIPSGTVTLTRQSEVDSFFINYPNCKILQGDLSISGSDILNLNGLQGLERVEGFNIQNNSVLLNLKGLDSLNYVGNFRVENNSMIMNFDGLNNLDTVYSFVIGENNKIENFQGLNNLKFIVNLYIRNNSLLKNFYGLSRLRSVPSSFIVNYNVSLNNFYGLDNINSIGDFTVVGNSSLVNFLGLQSLRNLQNFNISKNTSLIDFVGLDNITQLSRECSIEDNNSLINFYGLHNVRRFSDEISIYRNPLIQNLYGFNNINYIGKFRVGYNASLKNFQGLNNLVSIYFLEIVDNQSLKNLDGLQNLIHFGNGSIYVYNNSSLCSINELNHNLIFDGSVFFFISNNTSLSCCKILDTILQRNPMLTNININNNAYGCNNIIEIKTVVNQNCCTTKYTFLKDTICQGETVLFDNKILTTTGTYYDTIIANGMDSIIILQLKVYNKSYQILTKNFCIGQSFTLSNGKIITTNGTFKDTIPNVCDSIIEYHLNFVNNITTSINAIVCKGKTYTLPKGRIVTVSGIYKDTLPSSFGCDSIITTNLTITNPIPFNNNVTICSGKSYTLPNGNIVKTSGIYRDTILQANTCDSIVITNLTVNTYLQSTQTISVCLGKSYVLPSGRSVNQSGIYKDTIQNINGCDSIITTNLTITNPIPFTNNISICDGQTYTLPNGNKISTAGIYNDTIKKQNTCDSIVITNLSVFPNIFDVSLNPIDTIDAGNSIELKPFYSNQNAVSWSWLPNINLSCTTCENPIATPIQTIQYILNAKSNDGCEDTATTTVVVRQLEVYIPTAFSPNNDGVNDKLSVFATNPKVFSLRVYNRFGELVFESHDVNNKWNGTFNGQDCTVDSYSFVLEVTQFNNKQIQKQGSVLLVR